MKKKIIYILAGGMVLLSAFDFPLSGGKAETVCAEEVEMPWEEYNPEEYDTLEEEEWIVREEYYNYGEEEFYEESEELETYSEPESLEYLWNFDEQIMEGADPKRIDLLEKNKGEKVKPERNDSDEIWIGVYPLAQYPDFPTGCEVTSMTMVLNYEGFDVTIGELSDQYLKKGEPASESYREIFWGDPRSPEAFGCFAPVLADAANQYLEEQKTDKRAIDLTGTKFEDLYEALRYGYPVIVWGSMYIDQEIVEIGSWEIDGEQVTWPGNEHCMVLTGFSLKNDTVKVCDPLRGIVDYDRTAFERHYNDMERQAIIICSEEKKENEIPVILPDE